MAAGILDESAFVVLDGSGNGTVKLGPLTARETWMPANASVRVNRNPTNESQCQIYVGQTATDENFRDNTFSGSSGDTSGKVGGRSVAKGDYVWAVWTGGDPGQRACLNVTGTKNV